MRRKTALVTGDMGFLGRHFVAELRGRDYDVHGCDVQREFGVIPAYRDARHVFDHDDRRYDLAIHCAAIVGGREQIDGNPLATAESIELDSAYARWLVASRPGHALYVSSSAVYPVDLQSGHEVYPGSGFEIGLPADYRLREHDQRSDSTRVGTPDQVYGWSKLIGEVLMSRVRAAGVPVSIVRPFSGYGSDQSLDYPFPSFVRRATSRRDPFEIWGSGEQVRDFIHVDDVVNGALAVVTHDAETYASVRGAVRSEDPVVLGNAYRYLEDVLPVNLCTGVPTSFNALQQLVCRLAGYAPNVLRRSAAPTGVNYRVGDPTRMLSIYTPSVTLEEGVRRALRDDLFALTEQIAQDER